MRDRLLEKYEVQPPLKRVDSALRIAAISLAAPYDPYEQYGQAYLSRLESDPTLARKEQERAQQSSSKPAWDCESNLQLGWNVVSMTKMSREEVRVLRWCTCCPSHSIHAAKSSGMGMLLGQTFRAPPSFRFAFCKLWRRLLYSRAISICSLADIVSIWCSFWPCTTYYMSSNI
eukprot:scaffold53516_cov33-Tisochrysis_lutea.AAC.1